MDGVPPQKNQRVWDNRCRARTKHSSTDRRKVEAKAIPLSRERCASWPVECRHFPRRQRRHRRRRRHRPWRRAPRWTCATSSTRWPAVTKARAQVETPEAPRQVGHTASARTATQRLARAHLPWTYSPWDQACCCGAGNQSGAEGEGWAVAANLLLPCSLRAGRRHRQSRRCATVPGFGSDFTCR